MKAYTKTVTSALALIVAMPTLTTTALPTSFKLGLTTAISYSIGPKQAASVSGPAGAEVDVWFAENTYWAKNRSSRKVRVKLGIWSALLNPGQTLKFEGFGKGVQSFMGKPEAFYE